MAGFGTIRVSSQSAHDVAVLQTGNGGTAVTADPNDVTLAVGLVRLDAARFPDVTVNSTVPLSDTATLTGSTTGTNELVAIPGSVSLTGAEYNVQLNGFILTATYSQSPNDNALLAGDNHGGSIFEFEPGFANMASPLRQRRVRLRFRSRDRLDRRYRVHWRQRDRREHVYQPARHRNLDRHRLPPDGHRLRQGAGVQQRGRRCRQPYWHGPVAVHDADAVDTFHGPDRKSLGGGPGVRLSPRQRPGSAHTYAWTSDGTLMQQGLVARPVLGNAMHAAVVGVGGILAGWTTLDTGARAAAIGTLINPNYLWDLGGSGVHIFGAAPTAAAVNIETALNGLSDPNIQTELLHGLVLDGALDDPAMLGVFGAVENEGTVTQADLNDLDAILWSAQTLQMTAPVQDLTYSVLHGQLSNATFRSLSPAGDVMRRALGDLTVGWSGTQLTELVDKWFLGVDEPDTTLAAYSPVHGNLFNGTPQYTDVNQGTADDCWLMATAAEVALHEPSIIQHMFTHVATNTVNGVTVDVYAVRFAEAQDGALHYVTVDTELPGGGTVYTHTAGKPLWPALLEKAYAEASGAGWVVTGRPANDSYEGLEFGYTAYALPEFVRLWAPEQTADFNTALKTFRAGNLVTVDTGGSPQSNMIVPHHVYAVVGANATELQLYNPWGTDPDGDVRSNGKTYLGRFWVSRSFFDKNFVGMAISTDTPPTITGSSSLDLPLDLGALAAAFADANQPGHAHHDWLAQ